MVDGVFGDVFFSQVLVFDELRDAALFVNQLAAEQVTVGDVQNLGEVWRRPYVRIHRR